MWNEAEKNPITGEFHEKFDNLKIIPVGSNFFIVIYFYKQIVAIYEYYMVVAPPRDPVASTNMTSSLQDTWTRLNTHVLLHMTWSHTAVSCLLVNMAPLKSPSQLDPVLNIQTEFQFGIIDLIQFFSKLDSSLITLFSSNSNPNWILVWMSKLDFVSEKFGFS